MNAIDSVLRQTYSNFEIIVVDDSSTDDTNNIVRQYLHHANFHYFLVPESKGGNFARNLGVEKCNGRYIAFLDDDDEWFESKLEKQIETFNENPNVGLVYTGCQVVHTDHKGTYSITPKMKGNLSNEILMFNYIGSTSSVVILREIFNKAGHFDVNIPQLQDYDLWIRVCQLTKVDYVSEPLIKYLVHNSNQITSSVIKNQKSISIIDSKYTDLINNLSYFEKKRRYCHRFNAMGKRKMKNGENSEARKYFITSFFSYPNSSSIFFYLASFLKYELLVKVKSKF
jgi:glycosyltransferase involved in cell wall biosynthesis